MDCIDTSNTLSLSLFQIAVSLHPMVNNVSMHGSTVRGFQLKLWATIDSLHLGTISDSTSIVGVPTHCTLLHNANRMFLINELIFVIIVLHYGNHIKMSFNLQITVCVGHWFCYLVYGLPPFHMISAVQDFDQIQFLHALWN